MDRRSGTFKITGGSLTADFLQDGQYFRITGSIFNDGVHKYPSSSLKDESFSGSVWALAIPQPVINLATEIQEWRDKYETVDSVAMSPYNSESFGGYSYSKSGSGGSGGATNVTWKNAFAARMNMWRKLR